MTIEFKNDTTLNFACTMLEVEAQQLALNFFPPVIAVAKLLGDAIERTERSAKTVRLLADYMIALCGHDGPIILKPEDFSMFMFGNYVADSILDPILMLEDAVDSDVRISDDGHWYIWQPKTAPGIYCMLDVDQPLFFDEFGFMVDPLQPLDLDINRLGLRQAAKDAFRTTMLSRRLFAYDDVQIFYGNVHCTDDDGIFFEAVPNLELDNPSARLVVVGTWRFENKTFSPFNKEVIEELTKIGIVEKVVQYSFTEPDEMGQDYIVIPLQKAESQEMDEEEWQKNKNRIRPSVISAAVYRKVTELQDEMRLLERKLELIRLIETIGERYADEVAEYNGLVLELAERCEQNPIAQNPMVKAPHPPMLEMPDIRLTGEPLEWRIEDLEARLNSIREHKINIPASRETLRIQIEAWEEFAPQFIALQDFAQAASGWIYVDEGEARLTLPASGELVKSEYTYSDIGLDACTTRLNLLLNEFSEYPERQAKSLADMMHLCSKILSSRSANKEEEPVDDFAGK